METRETKSALATANRRVVRRLLLAVAAMFGFGFALAPLYDVLCQITGLNGKTGGRVAVARPVAVDETRTVTVEFVASLNAGAPWEFAPTVTRMAVHPGQYYQTRYLARNLTDQRAGRSGGAQRGAGSGGAAFPEGRVLLLQPPEVSSRARSGRCQSPSSSTRNCRRRCAP